MEIKRKGKCTPEEIADHANMWRNGFENEKQINFINCWSFDNEESYPLWSIYADVTLGIAVKSNIKKLKKSLESNSQQIFVGEVKYMDYYKEVFADKYDPNSLSFNLFLGLLTKRNIFEFETECRVIIPINDENEIKDLNDKDGILVSVNLEELIEEIYVAPKSPEWFKSLVQNVTIDYGINKVIKTSSINDPPPDFDLENYRTNT